VTDEAIEIEVDEDEPEICRDSDLWNAAKDCDGIVKPAPGGGIKCTKCSGWFCY